MEKHIHFYTRSNDGYFLLRGLPVEIYSEVNRPTAQLCYAKTTAEEMAVVIQVQGATILQFETKIKERKSLE